MFTFLDEEDAEEAEIDDVEPDTMFIDEDNLGDNNEDEDEEEEEEDEDEEEEEEEEIVEPKHEEVDTSRLLASGVSVTIVERPSAQKQSAEKPTETPTEPAPTLAPVSKVTADIGLGSDVSVTLVQKKKNDAPVALAEPAPAPPAIAEATRKGIISVKNHRELLQDPGAAKDIVQVRVAILKNR